MKCLESGTKVLVEMFIKDGFRDLEGNLVYIMAKTDDTHLRPISDNKVYLSNAQQICVYAEVVVPADRMRFYSVEQEARERVEAGGLY